MTPTAKELNDAYDEGWAAYDDGRTENPYNSREQFDLYVEWEEGYRDAEDEDWSDEDEDDEEW